MANKKEQYYPDTLLLEIRKVFRENNITVGNLSKRYNLSKDSTVKILKGEVKGTKELVIKNIGSSKPQICRNCGENEPTNFYKRCKSKCKSCTYTAVGYIEKPFLCSSCGETDPTKFRFKNKSKCKTCRSIKSKERYRNFTTEQKRDVIAKISDRLKNQDIDTLLKYRMTAAKCRANKADYEFDIDFDYLKELYEKQNGCCPYLGVKLGVTKDKIMRLGGINTLSIDRIDSNIGYVNGNVEIISLIVNVMKNQLDRNTFLNIIHTIHENTKGENFSMKK